jgi:hypothetical protein
MIHFKLSILTIYYLFRHFPQILMMTIYKRQQLPILQKTLVCQRLFRKKKLIILVGLLDALIISQKISGIGL